MKKSMTKRILCTVLSVCMLLALMPVGALTLTAQAASISGHWWQTENISEPTGSGTTGSPYLISTAAELGWFSYQVGHEGRSTICARLTADIDLSGHYWIPIGLNPTLFLGTLTIEAAFSGTFDGDGYCVKNISGTSVCFTDDFNFKCEVGSITASNDFYDLSSVCMFEYCDGATVKDLKIENITGYMAQGNSRFFFPSLYGLTFHTQYSTISNIYITGKFSGDFSGSFGIAYNGYSDFTDVYVDIANSSILFYDTKLFDATFTNVCGKYGTGENAVIKDIYDNVLSTQFSGFAKYTELFGNLSDDECKPSGSGTAASPYLITDDRELAWFSKTVNSGDTDACAKLMNDIDIVWNFVPIGTDSKQYAGTFDGNGKTINNLRISATSENTGLFGSVTTAAVLKNFTINNVSIYSTKSYIGAVCGNLRGTAENINVTGIIDILSSGSRTTIPSSTSHRFVGGMFGRVRDGASATNCHITADEVHSKLAAYDYVGGFFGEYQSGTASFTACSVTGLDIAAEKGNDFGSRCGGFYGDLSKDGSGVVTFEKCVVRDADITGYRSIGGFGYSLRNGSTMSNCAVINSTITDLYTGGDSEIGGLIGSVKSSNPACTISKCYSHITSLSQEASSDAVGFIGENEDECTFSNCCYTYFSSFAGTGNGSGTKITDSALKSGSALTTLNSKITGLGWYQKNNDFSSDGTGYPEVNKPITGTTSYSITKGTVPTASEAGFDLTGTSLALYTTNAYSGDTVSINVSVPTYYDFYLVVNGVEQEKNTSYFTMPAKATTVSIIFRPTVYDVYYFINNGGTSYKLSYLSYSVENRVFPDAPTTYENPSDSTETITVTGWATRLNSYALLDELPMPASGSNYVNVYACTKEILVSIPDVSPVVATNGTAATASGLGLPVRIPVVTHFSNNKMVRVTWDVTNISYDPTIIEEQTFTVNGTLSSLSFDDVVNLNSVSESVSVEVTVAAREVTGVEVATPPDKTVYFTGDTFDKTGLTLTATYSNGTTQTIATDDITCTPTTLRTSGENIGITATYDGKSCTFEVDVIALAVTGVAINTEPTKTSYYVGDTLDKTDLTLTANYNNGTTATITAADITCTPTTLRTAGENIEITATYCGKSCTFEVEVLIGGSCGSNLNWLLNTETGLLSITGTGAMETWNNYNVVSWYNYRSSIKTVSIADGVTSIGNYAFYYCTALESITIPDSVTSIGTSAFYFCTALESITIPDSVTSIGTSAFYFCTALESITIPDSVTSIANYAFSECSSLESITIPDSVTNIGTSAFYFCTALESITIPDSVTSIGSNAFEYCTALESITIPDSVTSIGNYAFSECSSLASITIPDSVTSIGNNAFYNCDALESITVDEANSNYSSEDGVLFNKDKTTLVKYPQGKSGTSFVIPSSVTSIDNSAFDSCTALASITIPDSVTSIGIYAFSDCSSLANITIPDSVTSIGDNTFYKCAALASITIPDSVTSIGNDAFYDCLAITDVYYFGADITNIVIRDVNIYNSYVTWHCAPVTMASDLSSAKTEYVIGDTLDTTGIVITATFNDSSTVTIPLDNVSFSPTALDTAGAQEISATYSNCSCTFEVNVTAQQQQQHKVTFIGKFGEVISEQTVDVGANAVIPTPATIAGYKFTGWDIDVNADTYKKSTDDITATAEYVIDEDVTYSVKVNGISQTHSQYELITITADATKDGKSFSYWTDEDGEIVSYYRTYSFYVHTAEALTPVYGVEVTGDKAAVRVTASEYNDYYKYLTVYSERSLSNDFTVMQHGILITDNETIGTSSTAFSIADGTPDGVLKATASTLGRTGLYTLTFDELNSYGSTIYARSYVKVIKDGNEYFIYSNISRITNSLAEDIVGNGDFSLELQGSTEFNAPQEEPDGEEKEATFFEKLVEIIMKVLAYIQKLFGWEIK